VLYTLTETASYEGRAGRGGRVLGAQWWPDLFSSWPHRPLREERGRGDLAKPHQYLGWNQNIKAIKNLEK